MEGAATVKGAATVMEIENLGEIRRMLAGRVSTILKASRIDADVSQEKLATLLGWTRNMIANLETGRRVVRVDDLVVIARALNIEPERLLRRILQW
jgi:ribosome-binding protein aMBF1 (putative translation factor)